MIGHIRSSGAFVDELLTAGVFGAGFSKSSLEMDFVSDGFVLEISAVSGSWGERSLCLQLHGRKDSSDIVGLACRLCA